MFRNDVSTTSLGYRQDSELAVGLLKYQSSTALHQQLSNQEFNINK